jgi:putative membrane protein
MRAGARFFYTEVYYSSMHIALRYITTVLAVALTVRLVPGVSYVDYLTLALVALVWSIIVMVIRPVLRILTLPLTIITFGLFSLVLNALLFWAVTLVVPGFTIDGFIPAFFGALVLSIVTWFIEKVL